MLAVTVQNDSLQIGERFSVSFQRTLRIPDDGTTYPLPPGLGHFPIVPVNTLLGELPAGWRERGGVVIPMYQREALWLSFHGSYWKPNAVQVAVGGVNAVTGEKWPDEPSDAPQNYLVVPDQPWLDGINAGGGFIRQFVAMPLGAGYTVEEQVTETAEGGLQLRVFEPKPGRFPDRAPAIRLAFRACACPAAPAQAMGLGTGGKMRQKLYPDDYGLDAWDPAVFGEVCVHIVNSEQFTALTGRPGPPSPINARTYTSYGFPWFDLYDEGRGDLAASSTLAGVKSVRQKDEETEQPGDDNTPVHVSPHQVETLDLPGI